MKIRTKITSSELASFKDTERRQTNSVDITGAYAVGKAFAPSMANAQLCCKEKAPYIAMCFVNPNDRRQLSKTDGLKW